jgi:hypothetical protein
MNAPTAEHGSNWYGTRRHYPDGWTPTYAGGYRGRALCWSDANPTEIFDQAAMDGFKKQYPTSKRVTVADLPLCKKCARKKTP